MPNTVTGLNIDPIGTTCVVSISDPGGVTASAYTTQNGSTNVTFPTTIAVPTNFFFTQTGLFTVSMRVGGVEVGTVGRTPVQVFLDSSASLVGGIGPAFIPGDTVLDALGLHALNVNAYGADATGVLDSTTSFQSAINAAIGAGALTTSRKSTNSVVIPGGTFLVTAPLNIQSVQGFSFRGAGPDVTTINYQPAGAVNNFLNIDGCANGRFGGFTVNCKGAAVTDVAVDLNWSGSGSIGRSSTANVFENIVVNSSTTGGPRAGFGVGVRSAGVQVDGTAFYNCVAVGKRVIGSGDTTKWQQGWALGNGTFGNVLDTFLYNCTAAQWFNGIAGNATNFFLFGSQPAGNDVDFAVSNSAVTAIRGLRSEGAGRLLTTTGGSASMVVSMEDITWIPNSINTDGQFIKVTNAGFLSLSNIILSQASTPAPVIFLQASGNNPTQILARGLSIQTPLSSLFSIPGANATATVLDYAQTNASNQVVTRTSQALVTKNGVIFTIGPDGQLAHTVNALSVSSGAFNIDASKGDIAAVTLTGNVGAATITNPLTGQVLVLEFIQDNTGTRTYTWPANCTFAGGAAPVASATGGYRDSVTFRYDGTNWQETARAVAVR